MATAEIVKSSDNAAASAAPVSLGKGAWDCDNNCEIPPDKEAEVFEEIATMEFPYEGIPTIPPRKNMTHMVRLGTKATPCCTHTFSFDGLMTDYYIVLVLHFRPSFAADVATVLKPIPIGLWDRYVMA